MADLIRDIEYFSEEHAATVAAQIKPAAITLAESDIIRLDMYIEDALMESYDIPAMGNCTVSDNSVSIDYFKILSDDLGFTSGIFDIRTRLLRNPVFPNIDLRVDQISRNKTEMRLDGWVDDDALTGIRRPDAHQTPPHIKDYAMRTWDIEDFQAEEAWVYARDKILLKPDGEWYQATRTRANEKGRTVEIQALHEANYQLTGPRGKYSETDPDNGYRTLELQHEKKNVRILNWTNDVHYKEASLLVKSAGKFPREIKAGDLVQLWEDLIDPTEITINIDLVEVDYEEGGIDLSGPDWTININREVGKSTELNSWNDILSSDQKTNSEVIDSVFSGSEMAELNINYAEFNNFIHFSSAEERLRNFKYKLQLLESYETEKSSVTSSATSSTFFTTQSTAVDNKINKLIGTFDGYEKKIYYSSASAYYIDTYGEHWNYTWPKTNTVKPYTQAHTTSSEATAWFTDAITRAQDYDNSNANSLRNLIPLHVKLDNQNNGYVLFVDMISQHFDRIYNYIDHIPMIHDKNENSRVGLSRDLLFDVLSSFGWKPESGLDLSELWSYHLGMNKDRTTTFNTSSTEAYGGTTMVTSSTGAMISQKDLETEPWSRILNNLPFLLKTKGSKRGVQALISTYGIPQSILKVQEFGGPDPSNPVSGSNLKEITQPSYATKFVAGGDCHMIGEYWSSNVNTAEIRFRTTASDGNRMSLMGGMDGTTAGWSVYIEPDTGKKGKVFFVVADSGGTKAITLGNLPIYDDDWWSVFLTLDPAAKTYKLKCQKVPDHSTGIITHTSESTVSFSNSHPVTGWDGSNIDGFFIGRSKITGYGADQFYYTGSLQEVRLWTEELSDYVLDIHTKAPISILGNSYSSSYDHLQFRLALGADTQKPTFTAPQNSQHPNQNNTHTAVYVNSGSFKSEFIEEDYFTPVPNSIGVRAVDNKVRIETNDNVGPLHPTETREVASGDLNPEDSNLLFVGFSPQDELDTDISLQFGGVSIDDIVGDPRDTYKPIYAELEEFRNAYFKKFNQSNNIWAYMRIIKYFNSALFKQIEQMLPARGNNIVGLMIKPSMLERPKLVTLPEPSWEDMHHRGLIDVYARKSVAIHPTITSSDGGNTVYEIDTTMISADEHDHSVVSRDEFGDPGNYQWSSIIQDNGVSAFEHIQYKGVAEPSWSGFQDPLLTPRNRDRDFTVQVNNAGLYGGQNVFTGSYENSELLTYASSSRTTWCTKYETQYSNSQEGNGYEQVDVQILSPSTNILNLYYNGCKMQSDDWNVPSADTIDAGPVVEIFETNPNALVADDNLTFHDGEINIR